nr:hypothetical protein CFP56_00632 [Quercus suber]
MGGSRALCPVTGFPSREKKRRRKGIFVRGTTPAKLGACAEGGFVATSEGRNVRSNHSLQMASVGKALLVMCSILIALHIQTSAISTAPGRSMSRAFEPHFQLDHIGS